MKYEGPAAMMHAHYKDIIDTIDPPLYQDCALYAMALVTHIMSIAHDGSWAKVSQDMGTISEHALKVINEEATRHPAQRVLH